jgi:hypothetical protein
LHVEIGLVTDVFDVALVRRERTILENAAVNGVGLEAVGLLDRFGTILFQEELRVWANGELAEVVGKADLILLANFWFVASVISITSV